MFNPDKLKEKARENAQKAVAPLDAILDEQRDRLKALRDQQTELSDIMSSELMGDAIGTGTMSELEAKLERYSIALKNVIVGSADYIRVQKKIQEV